MCLTIVSTGTLGRAVTKQARKRAEGVAATCREGDLGEVSMLQQETLQSAFNHNRPLLRRPSRQRGGQQPSQVLQSLPADNNSVHRETP